MKVREDQGRSARRMRGWALAAAGVLMGAAGAASAAIIGDAMGDTTFEAVYGHGGEQTLTSMFSDYVDAPTGQPLIVGDVNQGENPALSHQSQFQRFQVTEDASLSLTLMGGYAGYKNIFGIYTYDAEGDPLGASLTMTPLLTHKVDAVGTTITFAVEAGQYFGFYIDANGHTNSQGVYYSENVRNTDGDAHGVDTDHFLMFESDAGLLIAMEDLAYNPGSGRMGDQDYQDTVVGLLTYADGSAVNLRAEVPEPSSVLLYLTGITMLAMRPRRHGRAGAAS